MGCAACGSRYSSIDIFDGGRLRPVVIERVGWSRAIEAVIGTGLGNGG